MEAELLYIPCYCPSLQDQPSCSPGGPLSAGPKYGRHGAPWTQVTGISQGDSRELPGSIYRLLVIPSYIFIQDIGVRIFPRPGLLFAFMFYKRINQKIHLL